MKVFFLAGIFTAFCCLKTSGQYPDIKHSGTVALFITSFKPSVYWGYTYQHKKVSLSARVFGFTDERKAWKDNDFPIQKYLDFAILAGIPIASIRNFYFSSHAGISYINAIKQGNFIKEEYGWSRSRFRYFKEKKTSTIGFPIELKALFLINKGFGVTAIGYTNLNSKISTAGIGLGVSFGK